MYIDIGELLRQAVTVRRSYLASNTYTNTNTYSAKCTI